MHLSKEGISIGSRSGSSQCKIRKRRACSTISSSSSRKTLLIGKRRSSTSQMMMNSRRSSSYSSNNNVQKTVPQSPIKISEPRNNYGPVSARTLAATLWEMNEVPSPEPHSCITSHKVEASDEKQLHRSKITVRRSGSLPHHLSDPSHSPPASDDRMDRPENCNARRNSIVSQRLRLTDGTGGYDCHSATSLMEIEMRSRGGRTSSRSIQVVKNCLNELKIALSTSKELLKLLNQLWRVPDQKSSSSTSLISALRTELDRASLEVDQLFREQRSDRYEIEHLLKRLNDEKTAWKNKERERTRGALEIVTGDLEIERKLRRRSESLNKKLGAELVDTKAALLKAVKDLESEKRSREIMEQICNDLATGIEEDKVEVEDLKRESAKVKEEVEKEREMLQLADMLREERLQMKLSEAKYQFEEKNAAVDKLRSDLEMFLRAERFKEIRETSSDPRWSHEDLGKPLMISSHNEDKEIGTEDETEQQTEEVQENEHEQEQQQEEDNENDKDSNAESDLHSIELNMDNFSQNYKWSYNSKSEDFSGFDELNKNGRTLKSTSRHERRISEGVDWDFSAGNLSDWRCMYNQQRYSELKEENIEETLRYKAVNNLRDQILGSRTLPGSRGNASPTRQWNHGLQGRMGS